MLIDLGEAADFLANCQDAVIITHQSPDGDCIGSGFALKEILTSMGKRCRVVCSDQFPKSFGYITDKGSGEEFEPKTVISVDIADPKLMGELKEIYGNKVQLCIDHHVSNTGYAQRTFLNSSASAACELIYEIACEMGAELNKYAAECIYTGIATDTGCFKFDCTTPRCHEIAAELIRKFNISFAKINRKMFDVKSMGRIKLDCAAFDLMEYYLDNRFALLCLTSEKMKELGVESSELEGCANLPLQLESVEVGALLKQREDGAFKVSLRSANDVNVSEICGTLGGGGHAKAAGCLLKGTPEEVKARLVEAVGKAL